MTIRARIPLRAGDVELSRSVSVSAPALLSLPSRMEHADWRVDLECYGGSANLLEVP